MEFLPLAVCSFGGWLPAGAEFVGQVAARLAERFGVGNGAVLGQLWQRLLLTLWRANARAILHRAPMGELGVWDAGAITHKHAW